MKECEKQKLAEILESLQGNLSQRKFALKLGVTTHALNNWLNKTHLPNQENLELLAKYMNISVDDLLSMLRDEPVTSDSTKIKNATVAYELLQDLPLAEKVRLIKLLLNDFI